MRQFAEKPFQAPKIISESPKLIGQILLSYIWASFERQKVKIDFSGRAKLSGFATWECTAKEYLNSRKQVFLHNLRLTRPETQNLVYFLWEKIYVRKVCGVKPKGFWFNKLLLSFACLLKLSVSQILSHLL